RAPRVPAPPDVCTPPPTVSQGRPASPGGPSVSQRLPASTSMNHTHHGDIHRRAASCSNSYPVQHLSVSPAASQRHGSPSIFQYSLVPPSAPESLTISESLNISKCYPASPSSPAPSCITRYLPMPQRHPVSPRTSQRPNGTLCHHVPPSAAASPRITRASWCSNVISCHPVPPSTPASCDTSPTPRNTIQREELSAPIGKHVQYGTASLSPRESQTRTHDHRGAPAPLDLHRRAARSRQHHPREDQPTFADRRDRPLFPIPDRDRPQTPRSFQACRARGLCRYQPTPGGLGGSHRPAPRENPWKRQECGS